MLSPQSDEVRLFGFAATLFFQIRCRFRGSEWRNADAPQWHGQVMQRRERVCPGILKKLTKKKVGL